MKETSTKTTYNLRGKQKRFCEEYVVDQNATQAAIRAGYSEKTARSIGCENLTKPNILLYISDLQKEIQERNKITIDECVSLLAKMARFDIADLYNDDGSLKPIKEIPKDVRLVIEGIDSDEIRHNDVVIGNTKKVKLSSRRANLIELMKHLGGYEKDNKQKSTSAVTIFEIPDNGRG
ncbi:terminase small subunit [Flavicella sediminum]|uniref:terminase small subunit n=1 Tax=Flavicella sediminum TaxID=2585141 RepID=UPI00140B1E1C|nr:terminase small subunit [Flavicella sediminum]